MADFEFGLAAFVVTIAAIFVALAHIFEKHRSRLVAAGISLVALAVVIFGIGAAQTFRDSPATVAARTAGEAQGDWQGSITLLHHQTEMTLTITKYQDGHLRAQMSFAQVPSFFPISPGGTSGTGSCHGTAVELSFLHGDITLTGSPPTHSGGPFIATLRFFALHKSIKLYRL